MFPLLTQGFPTPQSKISYIYLIKLLAPGMTLLDFPQNSTVNHFSASCLTAAYPDSFPLLHWLPLPCTEGNNALLKEDALLFQSWLVADTPSPLPFQSLKHFHSPQVDLLPPSTAIFWSALSSFTSQLIIYFLPFTEKTGATQNQ